MQNSKYLSEVNGMKHLITTTVQIDCNLSSFPEAPVLVLK